MSKYETEVFQSIATNIDLSVFFSQYNYNDLGNEIL